ncbi:MAG TPA: polyhydroxyalkanoic acid system family protein [Candidatus Aminicenantes bacterium]|nr:polyhydroxyalkanoic acid system family protein [Candidatus Aminicenantes bacterium]
MALLQFAIPHTVDVPTARERLDRYVRQKSTEYDDRLTGASWEWVGTALTFHGGAGGYQVSGRLEVTADAVTVTAEVPAMVLFFRDQIVTRARQELGRALAG